MTIRQEDFGTVGPHGRDELFARTRENANVVAIGLGVLQRDGEPTDEPAIVVCVADRRGGTNLSGGERLPSVHRHNGRSLPLDVQETGPFYAIAFAGRERPAPSGISIGHFRITAGTLGTLVDDVTDGATCILSNNHVLANKNAAAPGDPILQPGPFDGGVAPRDQIATLRRFIPINFSGGINRVDAAIAGPVGPDAVVNRMKNELMDVICAVHPAVGLLFAGSKLETLLNPASDVLAALRIRFPDCLLLARNISGSVLERAISARAFERGTGGLYLRYRTIGTDGVDRFL